MKLRHMLELLGCDVVVAIIVGKTLLFKGVLGECEVARVWEYQAREIDSLTVSGESLIIEVSNE